jgi:hypothetical protein
MIFRTEHNPILVIEEFTCSYRKWNSDSPFTSVPLTNAKEREDQEWKNRDKGAGGLQGIRLRIAAPSEWVVSAKKRQWLDSFSFCDKQQS